MAGMMRVRIIKHLCQGHAMCVITCPEVFKSNDEDGHGVVIAEDVPRALEAKVQAALKSCPEQAIEID